MFVEEKLGILSYLVEFFFGDLLGIFVRVGGFVYLFVRFFIKCLLRGNKEEFIVFFNKDSFVIVFSE